jgi:hypothetical protein
MDPQLLAALLSAAKGGNKNVGSVLGNFDNPVALALAGVLDPYYSQDGGVQSLYKQYKGASDTPDSVNVVLDMIDQGANPYQIEAKINSLDEKVVTDGGYTPAQLTAMGKQMYDEKAKGVGKSVFEKAGLRNPNDVYSLEDVPLNAGESQKFAQYLDRAQQTNNQTSNYEADLRIAKNNYDRLLKQMKGRHGDDRGTQPRDLGQSSVYYNTGATITPYGGGEPQPYDPSADLKNVYNPMKQDPRKKKKGEPDIPAGPTQDDINAIARAQVSLYEQNLKVLNDQRRAQAVREGALNRASSSGKTPFTDQAAQFLQFIQKSK